MCHSRVFWMDACGPGGPRRRRHRGRHGFRFEFGPRGPRRGFFRGGEVRLALLSLLAKEPGHGYDLMRRLEERSGGQYKASAGTVYPVLQQLEDEGLVTSSQESGKRVYTITDAGRREAMDHEDAIDRIWRRADRWKEWEWGGRPEGVEIGLTMGRLAKAALRAVGRVPDQADDVQRVLEKALDDIRNLDKR